MKKAEAAAYAEAQTKGSGWLPDPLRTVPAVSEISGQIYSSKDVRDDADENEADMMDGDTGTGEAMTFLEAAE